MSAIPAATWRKVRTISGRPAKSTLCLAQLSPSPSKSSLLIEFTADA